MNISLYAFHITHPMNTNNPFVGVVLGEDQEHALEMATEAWGDASKYNPISLDKVADYSVNGTMVCVSKLPYHP